MSEHKFSIIDGSLVFKVSREPVNPVDYWEWDTPYKLEETRL